MLFYAPKYGYLPANQIRRVAHSYDEWSLIDADGSAHRVSSLTQCVVWPPIPAPPGWQVVNAWPNHKGSAPEVTLERLAVVAWQVHGNIAEPIVCSRMAEIWALQSTNGGALTAPGQWVFPDEAAYIAYAREEYRKRSVKEQSAAD
ncbi:MAG TPA: hypothetical protein VLG66_16280 [Alphaproteobacteria bacterium]|nr:hypothetical protein [Alphaproteobacteria bacterium]